MMVMRANERIHAEALLSRLNAMDSTQDTKYFTVPCPRTHGVQSQKPFYVEFKRKKPVTVVKN